MPVIPSLECRGNILGSSFNSWRQMKFAVAQDAGCSATVQWTRRDPRPHHRWWAYSGVLLRGYTTRIIGGEEPHSSWGRCAWNYVWSTGGRIMWPAEYLWLCPGLGCLLGSAESSRIYALLYLKWACVTGQRLVSSMPSESPDGTTSI